METLRPRLLRTYVGPGSRRGAAGAGVGLRRQPWPSAPWLSPQVDPRHLFSTSSSAEGSSPSASPLSEDPDFQPCLPPKARRQQRPKARPRRGGRKGRASLQGGREARAPQQRSKEDRASLQEGRVTRALRRRGQENRAPHQRGVAEGGRSTSSGGGASGCSFVPPTPLRRNITLRPRRPSLLQDDWGDALARTRAGLRRRPPLLCSTPAPCRHLPPAAKRDSLEEEESVLQSSGSILCCSSNGDGRPQLGLKEDGCPAPHNVLTELSLLNMDEDLDLQKAGGSLELFTREDSRGLKRKSACEMLQKRPPPTPMSQRRLGQSHSHTPLQSHFGLHSHSVQGETEAWEGLTASPGNPSSTSKQLHCHHLQVADKDCQLPLSPEAKIAPPSTLRGALQLQASICNGKIALSLPKCPTSLIKRQRISVQVSPTLAKKVAGLNGTYSEEGNDCNIDQSSPHFQPVVVLDSQAVPDWLASQSTKKQASGQVSQKEGYNLQSDSSRPMPRTFDTRRPVGPTFGPGSSAKHCISGFSTKRWTQQKKRGQVKRKKNKKQQADASFLQCHRLNEIENDIPLSLLSPDCSLLKNSALWRRIRASFSLHKKKKILSEIESFNSSASLQSPQPQSPKTPFTQKLGYSICPSSSMVVLSAMNSPSTPEMILTDKEKVYGECQQVGPISFEECIPPEKMEKCEKIGEGVFGEVFRTDGERGTVALKIIPIEGSDKVNGEPQKTFSEILPEIIISKELSLLAEEEDNQTSGFISLYSVHCVQGAYPKCLLKAWDEYHRLRESENDRPDFFGNQQLFMILEFEFGGNDLENMRNKQLNSVAVAKSILYQVTASLAVAEEALHFEHRDLHWGNVLVKKTHLKDLSFRLNGETHSVSTQGIFVNIIDYTFSRLEKDGLTVYCDLSTDEEVFQGRGDYQFDIYRQMREENANNWADYFPHSNILWLHYLTDKLLKAVTYKKKPTTSSLKQVRKQLQLFSDEVLRFRSARDLLTKSNFFQ